MALYFLSYDLRNRRNYQPLYDEMARFGARQTLESVYFLTHASTTAAALRDHFRQFVDGDDGIIVIQASHWAGSRLTNNPPETW